MPARGFSSITFLHSTAEHIRCVGKPAYLYYFGDHDPSGVRIDQTIEKRLRQFAPDADIHFERVAVLPLQIRNLKLPTRPTKTDKNTHAKGFQGDSVDIDAVPAATLRQMVRDCIERHIDRRRLEQIKLIEAQERHVLEMVAENAQGFGQQYEEDDEDPEVD
jgi:hypothetical protein